MRAGTPRKSRAKPPRVDRDWWWRSEAMAPSPRWRPVCWRRTSAGAPQSELGIIPRGTGGDFRRTLDLPTDVTKAAQRVRDSAAHLIDAGRVQFTMPDGGSATRTFVNVASFGFSSSVAAAANSSSKALGAKAAFLGATVRTLMNYENAEVMLELDGGEPIRRTVMLAAVGNGRYFGGGMKICPDAKLDSGALSLVIVGDLSKAKTLANIPRLFAGTHLALEEVRAATIHTAARHPRRSLTANPHRAGRRDPRLLASHVRGAARECCPCRF